jgi:hypothetical protein
VATRVIYDVEPRPDGKWGVQRRGTDRAANVYDDKADAIARGRELCKEVGGDAQLVIRKANGQIETEYTYGNDPYPPKG